MQSVLRLLAAISNETHIPILLIGGYALQAYGVSRQTVDVDVLVSDAHAGAVDTALQGAGYAQMVRSEIFARYRHPSIVLADVDVLFVDGDTAKRMSELATQYVSGEATYLVPAISHIIAMKLHAIRSNPQREPRDFADIVELIRANPGRLGQDELRGLCATYGPEGVWEKLEAVLWKTR
jgi:Nucleotidyl transferase AbiEii toxin, Type IV TA system